MCGSATHPGGGIMGAPGRNAALEILGSSARQAGRKRSDRRHLRRRRTQRPGGSSGAVLAAALKTLVLEARAAVGGAAITGELSPGFRISTLAHAAQPAAALMSELRSRPNTASS